MNRRKWLCVPLLFSLAVVACASNDAADQGATSDTAELNAAPSCERAPTQVCFFEHANFRGNSFCRNVGEQIDNLDGSGFNDRISSIKIIPDDGSVSIRLNTDAFFTGQTQQTSSSVSDLNSAPGFGPEWNDKISSLSISRVFRRGRACFYKDAHFVGELFCLNAGESNTNLGDTPGANDQISSIRIEGDVTVVVAEHAHFGGETRRLNASVENFADSRFNDRISSLVVQRCQ